MRRNLSLCMFLAVLLTILQVPASVVTAQETGRSKPRIAVLEFKNKAVSRWWSHGGAEAAQDVFVTELAKGGKFRVVEREQLEALMQEKNLTLSGDLDPSTAVRVGKLLGVNYLLTGTVVEFGITKKGAAARGARRGRAVFVAAVNARLIDTSTGEIVWADEASAEESSVKGVGVGGSGGAGDGRMFDKMMRPVIQELTASLKAANLKP